MVEKLGHSKADVAVAYMKQVFRVPRSDIIRCSASRSRWRAARRLASRAQASRRRSGRLSRERVADQGAQRRALPVRQLLRAGLARGEGRPPPPVADAPQGGRAQGGALEPGDHRPAAPGLLRGAPQVRQRTTRRSSCGSRSGRSSPGRSTCRRRRSSRPPRSGPSTTSPSTRTPRRTRSRGRRAPRRRRPSAARSRARGPASARLRRGISTRARWATGCPTCARCTPCSRRRARPWCTCRSAPASTACSCSRAASEPAR